ncbi:hypothetical protein B0H17DRAFT_1267877 [Mycena rosella]|uniref:Uncharacterized protein n=1 Tax=Mycena rosella TaxID=1033263 RepID=A0AAD7G0P9_MYCRO|nr:hypothetical protein B0H17DRAFT_1267877 [Mycena rosella]
MVAILPAYPADTEVDCVDLKVGKAEVVDERQTGHQRQCKGVQRFGCTETTQADRNPSCGKRHCEFYGEPAAGSLDRVAGLIEARMIRPWVKSQSEFHWCTLASGQRRKQGGKHAISATRHQAAIGTIREIAVRLYPSWSRRVTCSHRHASRADGCHLSSALFGSGTYFAVAPDPHHVFHESAARVRDHSCSSALYLLTASHSCLRSRRNSLALGGEQTRRLARVCAPTRTYAARTVLLIFTTQPRSVPLSFPSRLLTENRPYYTPHTQGCL